MFPRELEFDRQQQSPVGYDIFGDEIYKGNVCWYGDEGMMCDPGADNFDSGNQIMSLLVQQLGTRYILEQLGYEKRVID